MRVLIHNVDHGQCAVITMPNGERMMIDCGVLREGDSYWWPSVHYSGQRFAELALTNLDEDHAEDFESVQRYAPPDWILSNPTVWHQQLLALKPEGLGKGIQSVDRWMISPKNPAPRPIDFGGVARRWYCNTYTPGDKTNDLSVVIILQYGPFKILFSGDMERAGWRRLLLRPDFVSDLKTVNVFVASHHGRENGCLGELFTGWGPHVFIISDGAIEFDSQETTDWYRTRAWGIPVVATQERRYVYTTRSDGTLQIDVGPDGRYLVTPGVWVPTTSKVKIA
jgi:beta-lactamase superfamily II metal-dependent hydrolase